MPTFKAFLTLVLAVLLHGSCLTGHGDEPHPPQPVRVPRVAADHSEHRPPRYPRPGRRRQPPRRGWRGARHPGVPSGAWSGRVVARTGCSSSDDYDSSSSPAAGTRCDTGVPPATATVTHVSVHGPGGLAAYSVSLVDGFNLPVMVTPHRFEQGQHQRCPSLGCAVDLDVDCPATPGPRRRVQGPGSGALL
ncbi:hypothetical protein ZWY2020_052172 [Hordeum vulgare]|nr:hypothetical protein ZWY2020_052172 [Hordeum vulgare]